MAKTTSASCRDIYLETEDRQKYISANIWSSVPVVLSAALLNIEITCAKIHLVYLYSFGTWSPEKDMSQLKK